MMRSRIVSASRLLLPFILFLTTCGHASVRAHETSIGEVTDAVIRPLMHKYDIPGMAIAVTENGKSYFYNYGIASRETRQPVTSRTLFEIGSLSKTFAATLAAYASVSSDISLSDSVSKDLPSLRGGSFDHISVLELGTHTSGLPLFVPDQINNWLQLTSYLSHWKPQHIAGTHRIYSNVGAGLLGVIAAAGMHESYEDALRKRLFPALGMDHSYINVPRNQMKYYASGYTQANEPIRLHEGILGAEAYGIKSCSADLIRFVEANMQERTLDATVQKAIASTHIGYFVSGSLIQDLVWEEYPYPTKLERILEGNAATFKDTPAIRLQPPLEPRTDVLINKTGSTNGFSAYVAFIPIRKLGIVILANKSFPLAERVIAGYEILSRLSRPMAPAEDLNSSVTGKAVAAANRPTQVLERVALSGTRYQLGMGVGQMAPNTVKSRRVQSGPEVVYVLTGELIFMVEGRPNRIIKAGESMQIPAGLVHATKAGPEGAKFLASWIHESGKPFVKPVP